MTTRMARAAEKPRRQGRTAGGLVVFNHIDKHRPQDRLHVAEQVVNLPVASADTGNLNHPAMRALDALNAKYGRGTVTFATMGRTLCWKLWSDFKSPRHTTAWEELLSV